MDYPVKLERDDNDTILVSFPDFPEAHTYGDNVEDALMHAPDALATVIDAYIKDRRDIPAPSARVTKHRVTVPALIEAKIRLYETMREAKIGKSELAKRLDWHLPQVDRLLAMTHGSKLEQLETAFRALGKRLVIDVEDVTVRRGPTKVGASSAPAHLRISTVGTTPMIISGAPPAAKRRFRRRIFSQSQSAAGRRVGERRPAPRATTGCRSRGHPTRCTPTGRRSQPLPKPAPRTTAPDHQEDTRANQRRHVCVSLAGPAAGVPCSEPDRSPSPSHCCSSAV